MDAYGYIYKLEADSANRVYAAVLKMGVETNAYDEETYSLNMLAADGNTIVANVDDDYKDEYTKIMGTKPGSVTAATIVKYHLNSSNEIDYIEKVTSSKVTEKKKVSSSGYYDGYAIANNVTIFSFNGGDYSKADNYSIVSYEDAIGKEFVASYAINGDSKIVMMVADDLVAQDVIFGIVKGSGTNNSDAGAYVEILQTNGEVVSYDCSPAVCTAITNASGTNGKNLMAFKVSSNNEIKGATAGTNWNVMPTDGNVHKDFLGGNDVKGVTGKVTEINNDRVTFEGNTDATYGYSNDVIVFDYDVDDAEYKADASTSDIEVNKDTIAMFDTNEDGVYDIIVIL